MDRNRWYDHCEALVDTHAEGHGGHHHADAALHPRGVDSLASRRIQISMIELAGHASFCQALPQLLCFLACEAVDEARSTSDLTPDSL